MPAPQDRHKGLSQVLIDLKSPGVTVRPIVDLTGDAHFNEVVFEDVFLPQEAMLGNEGDGWKQVTSELAYERSGPERIYSSVVLLDEWLAYLRTQGQPSERSLALAGRVLSVAGWRATVRRSIQPMSPPVFPLGASENCLAASANDCLPASTFCLSSAARALAALVAVSSASASTTDVEEYLYELV